jgi:Ni/Fe-hydrogenase 1 B-type cytochrome subunit
MSGGEATFSYWFGEVRFIHFIAGFIFFFNFAFRIYWGFVGNKYSGWRNYIPLKKSQWLEIIEVIKVDILQVKSKPVESIGHNAMASVIYFGLFLAFLLQCLTGFALYAQMSKALFPQLFSWIIPLLGGDLLVRHIHHALMWFFILFTIVHVYLVCYHDYIERRGVTSSMIGGWKFIEEEMALEEEIEEQEQAAARKKAAAKAVTEAEQGNKPSA